MSCSCIRGTCTLVKMYQTIITVGRRWQTYCAPLLYRKTRIYSLSSSFQNKYHKQNTSIIGSTSGWPTIILLKRDTQTRHICSSGNQKVFYFFFRLHFHLTQAVQCRPVCAVFLFDFCIIYRFLVKKNIKDKLRQYTSFGNLIFAPQVQRLCPCCSVRGFSSTLRPFAAIPLSVPHFLSNSSAVCLINIKAGKK